MLWRASFCPLGFPYEIEVWTIAMQAKMLKKWWKEVDFFYWFYSKNNERNSLRCVSVNCFTYFNHFCLILVFGIWQSFEGCFSHMPVDLHCSCAFHVVPYFIELLAIKLFGIWEWNQKKRKRKSRSAGRVASPHFGTLLYLQRLFTLYNFFLGSFQRKMLYLKFF